MLALLAVKLLMPSFMPTIKREASLIYFLLLWALGFLLNVVSDIAYYASYGFVATDIVGIFGTLCSLAAGGVLGLFAWNLLKSKTSIEEPVTQVL
jgi:hypothetical protein